MSATFIEPMAATEIESALADLPGWSMVDNRLTKRFEFQSFEEAISFMIRVALHAEKMEHHPEVICNFTTVVVNLCTHEAGDMVTERDIGLARRIREFNWVE